jgi:molecular chaperone Hsp33
VIAATGLVQRAQHIHRCSPTATAALGRTLCAASLLGEAMKEDDASLTIRINGGGPLGGVIAISDHEGYVRGAVGNPAVDLPLRADGKLDVGGAVGHDGMLTVSRDIGLKEPYVGSVELRSGEIAEDLTAYLLESDQVPSACALGVLIDTDGSVKTAGGFLVQLMPGAPDELIAKLEDNIFLMDQLTTILAEDGTDEVFRQVLKGFEYHVVQVIDDNGFAMLQGKIKCALLYAQPYRLLGTVCAVRADNAVEQRFPFLVRNGHGKAKIPGFV